MPNDNQKSATNNQQPQTGSMPPVPTDDMSPLVVEETAPPMLSTSDLPVVEERKAETNETDSGSAAPSDDIVMAPVVTTQKKKFAGGKVIATILGLFLLVGGLGAGTFLVQQNQDIREKAGSCAPGCGPGLMCDGAGGCVPRGTTQEQIDSGEVDPIYFDDDNDLGWNDWQDEQQGNPTEICELPASLKFLCVAGVAVTNNHPYLPAGYTRYCSTDTGRCTISGPGCNSSTTDKSGVCGEYKIVGSSGGDDTPPPSTPSITAQCQNVKAYDEAWTLLTNTQLAQLKTGDSVNFCVAGSATGGSFDKARFTINTVLQPETTTIRPSSTDFCQSYVIPAGVTSFNVSAQINHVTLGWK